MWRTYRMPLPCPQQGPGAPLKSNTWIFQCWTQVDDICEQRLGHSKVSSGYQGNSEQDGFCCQRNSSPHPKKKPTLVFRGLGILECYDEKLCRTLIVNHIAGDVSGENSRIKRVLVRGERKSPEGGTDPSHGMRLPSGPEILLSPQSAQLPFCA